MASIIFLSNSQTPRLFFFFFHQSVVDRQGRVGAEAAQEKPTTKKRIIAAVTFLQSYNFPTHSVHTTLYTAFVTVIMNEGYSPSSRKK